MESQYKIPPVENSLVDISRGIKRFGGNHEAYIHVLRTYAKTTGQMLQKANETKDGSLLDYAVIVHGIKGSSRIICADLIGSKAEALEEAAKTGDMDFVKNKHHEFAKTTEDLITAIKELLDEIIPKKPKLNKDKPDTEVLLKLIKACENFDMDEAESAINEIEEYDYETGNELVFWLRENVDLMNWKQIKERLLALSQNWN